MSAAQRRAAKKDGDCPYCHGPLNEPCVAREMTNDEAVAEVKRWIKLCGALEEKDGGPLDLPAGIVLRALDEIEEEGTLVHHCVCRNGTIFVAVDFPGTPVVILDKALGIHLTPCAALEASDQMGKTIASWARTVVSS